MVTPRPLSFVAIDFETASNNRASVCQVGLVKVRDGQVVKSDSWYVIPPTGLDDFSPRNVAIHKINARTVVSQGGISWLESLARISDIRENLPLVAHNSSFDASVFKMASTYVGGTVPTLEWLDTLKLARREFPDLPKHTLPVVAQHVGVDNLKHHDAVADAMAAAQIVLHVAALKSASSIDHIFSTKKASSAGLDSKIFADPGYSRSKAELPKPNPNADPGHPLFGQHVVITGSFPKWSRDEVMHLLADRGATVQNNVTKKTTVLMLADWETMPRPYNPLIGSSKERKAGDYQAKGQNIEFVDRRTAERWLKLKRTHLAKFKPRVDREQKSASSGVREVLSSRGNQSFGSYGQGLKDNIPAGGYLAPADPPRLIPPVASGGGSTGRDVRDEVADKSETTAHSGRRNFIQSPAVLNPRKIVPPHLSPDSGRSGKEGKGSGYQSYTRFHPGNRGDSKTVKRAVALTLRIVGWALLGLGALGAVVSPLPLVGGFIEGDGELIFGSVFLLVVFVIVVGLGGNLVRYGKRLANGVNRSAA